jgi:hypothetical protein
MQHTPFGMFLSRMLPFAGEAVDICFQIPSSGIQEIILEKYGLKRHFCGSKNTKSSLENGRIVEGCCRAQVTLESI